MPNTPLILGLTTDNCAVPFLSDNSGRLSSGESTGEIICVDGCGAVGGGKAYLGSGTLVATLMDFSELNIANKVRIFTWSIANPPSLTLSYMTLFGEFDFGEDIRIGFTKDRRYISVFAVNTAHGYFDGCCFKVENGFLKVLGF